MVYRCMQPPCLNLIRCCSSFADVINAVLYIMLQIYMICLKKQTGQSPRRLVAYLLIPSSSWYNLLPRVNESSKCPRTQTSLLVLLTRNVLKLVLLIDSILNTILKERKGTLFIKVPSCSSAGALIGDTVN